MRLERVYAARIRAAIVCWTGTGVRIDVEARVLDAAEPLWSVLVKVFVLGIGLGCVIQTLVVAVQEISPVRLSAFRVSATVTARYRAFRSVGVISGTPDSFVSLIALSPGVMPQKRS